nr:MULTISPECIES: adenylosuccinate synthase [Chromohalobacter]
MNHADLCAIAVKWLQREPSKKGHGCDVAVSEVKTGYTGEIPDAVGFRRKDDHRDGSVVVEVKVSRADFLADGKKAHRVDGGVGNWRYFMCPEGLIAADELPPGWGLLWVNKRGHVKPQAGPVLQRHYGPYVEALCEWRHDTDHGREQFILVKLLSRVGDVEEMNSRLKQAYSEQSRLAKRCNDLTRELHSSSPAVPDSLIKGLQSIAPCDGCGSSHGEHHAPECPSVDAFAAGRIAESEARS